MADDKQVEEIGREPGTERRRVNPTVMLQPIAGASMLGMFALAAVSFVIGAQYAGWYAGPQDMLLGPIAGLVGGVAQFLAAMWAFRARDGLSTAFHGSWGAFWMGLGLLTLLFGVGAVPAGVQAPAMGAVGLWFIALAFISAACALAALATNGAMFSVMAVTTAASTAFAIGLLSASAGTLAVGGYLFIISAILAWYTGGAMLVEDAFGRSYLPVGNFRTSVQEDDISSGIGEPGVLHGQWGAYGRHVRNVRHHRATG